MTTNLLAQVSKILLSPLALIYGILVGVRRFLYRTNLLRSSRFDIPTISVGNLNVGGAGKTPHIEYLIRILQPYINVSVLSRGYKRQTEGFLMVETNSTVLDVGDEPLQYKLKYPSVPVAVAEKRAYAIPQMLYRHNEIQTVLLDDAFQHLAVKPYLNILLTEFSDPFTDDFLLPAGRLRDWRVTYRHADIIIITKCPFDVGDTEKQHFIQKINPYPYQRLYFTYFNYGTPYALFQSAPPLFIETAEPSQPSPDWMKAQILDADTDVLLVCGIAKTDYLLDYLSSKVKSVTTMAFEDHRLFSNYDVAQFKRLYEGMMGKKRIIITTEKDGTRLLLHQKYLVENQLDIYVLPIEVAFHFGEGEVFNNDVKKVLLNFKV
jgi:tetraacyldisaccharide 4'-kinase